MWVRREKGGFTAEPWNKHKYIRKDGVLKLGQSGQQQSSGNALSKETDRKDSTQIKRKLLRESKEFGESTQSAGLEFRAGG